MMRILKALLYNHLRLCSQRGSEITPERSMLRSSWQIAKYIDVGSYVAPIAP
jgi:hypothetical protein